MKEWISARIPDDLKAEIQEMADRERRSLSQMTLILLEEALAARKPEEGSNAAD